MAQLGEADEALSQIQLAEQVIERFVTTRIVGHLAWALPEPQVTNRRRQLTQLRRRAEGIMRATQQGYLEGRALQEALGTYQRVWAQVEELEQEPQSPARESSAVEIRYDRAVVEDFVTRLPEALRVDVRRPVRLSRCSGRLAGQAPLCRCTRRGSVSECTRS